MSSVEPRYRFSNGHGGYKSRWARHVARKSLAHETQIIIPKLKELKEFKVVKEIKELPELPEVKPDTEIKSDADREANIKAKAEIDRQLRVIAGAAQKLTLGQSPAIPGQFKMGIVGSGIAGLFTAALIDKLNERIPELKISYDILEAGGRKRLGGRLYTHRFAGEPKEHQYYDVGAMRFPNNEVMERTFRLFDFLDITEQGSECPRLIPYYLEDYQDVCPTLFNEVRKFGRVKFDAAHGDDDKHGDPYGVNKWLASEHSDRIDDCLMKRQPQDVIEEAIGSLKKKLKEDLKDSTDEDSVKSGWRALSKADFLTTRELFRRNDKGKDGIEGSGVKGRGYNFNTIEWLETYAYATGWYNQSLAETVLESLDFDPPEKSDKESTKVENYWYCVEGGTQMVAEKLASKLSKQPEFNKRVTAIKSDLEKGTITLSTETTKPDGWDPKKKFKPTPEDREYFTVFNSTTLGALQRMDLSQAKLLYGTKQAIRSLNYGASCKVAIQFKEMWWQNSPWGITKGGISKTDLPIRVCVYPSYNLNDRDEDGKGEGVLLCSYTWAQDAQRIGALIDPKSPENEDELRDLVLSNLAHLHAKTGTEYTYEKVLGILHENYMTHHAYDWYNDPNMSGAFGYFGPGQFSKMWPSIIEPNGWLFLIGEAASAHHAWIVGALESSVRAMHQLLTMLNLDVKKREEAKKIEVPFEGYDKAIKFLTGPEDDPEHKHDDWQLPFVGLPKEIPNRRDGTSKDKEIQETLEGGSTNLSFVATQVIVSYFRMRLREEMEKEDE